MTENLPAVRRTTDVATQDTDSWVSQMGPIVQLANHIAKTEFVPKGLRGSEAATAAAILYGREVGLPPMTSLQQVHVIEGRPAMSSEGMRALILAGGHELEVTEANGARVVMRARRRGAETWTSLEWSLDMARDAGLAGKQVWKSYPRQMLTARCTAELARLVFPDVIHGFRALEEFEDGAGPAEGSGPSASSSSSTVQRKTRTSKTARAVEAPTERPALEGPPLPGEPGYESAGEGSSEGESVGPSHVATDVPLPVGDEAPGEEVAPPPSEPVDVEPTSPPPPDEPPHERPATKPDLRMMHASFKDVLSGIDDEEAKRSERLAITCQIIGRIVETSNELSSREARLVADTVARFKSLPDLYALLDATADPA